MEGCLLLHTFGEPAQRGLFRQTKGFKKLVIEGQVKFGVNSLVIPAHIFQRGGREIEDIIGDRTHSFLDSWIFVDRGAV